MRCLGGGFFTIILVTSLAAAKEVRISALTNQDLGETSAISAVCQKDKLHMSCQISQVMVRRRLDPTKLEEEKKKRLDEGKKDLRSFAEGEMCKDKNKIKESMRNLPKPAQPEPNRVKYWDDVHTSGGDDDADTDGALPRTHGGDVVLL